ncbi:importin subunit alpha-1a-like [Lycium barbarum]|uniref:importin subunit alpha-1a-like n=1 Tax=Lycium barbarum TaxID=112863 RepID=UPI00293F2E80|nr:importin subunit alpha-1a-like [Lycium barbarum]
MVNASRRRRCFRPAIVATRRRQLSNYCKTPVITNDGVCKQLFKLLEHPLPSVVSPALHTLGNIVLRNDIQSQQTMEPFVDTSRPLKS